MQRRMVDMPLSAKQQWQMVAVAVGSGIALACFLVWLIRPTRHRPRDVHWGTVTVIAFVDGVELHRFARGAMWPLTVADGELEGTADGIGVFWHRGEAYLVCDLWLRAEGLGIPRVDVLAKRPVTLPIDHGLASLHLMASDLCRVARERQRGTSQELLPKKPTRQDAP